MNSPAKGSRRLFVYGSLRSDAPRQRAGAREGFQALAAGAELEGPAKMAGRLFAPSWYPGFAPKAGGQVTDQQVKGAQVKGEVWRILDRKLLGRLDGYEGKAFLREEGQAVFRDGLTVTALVYRYLGDLRGVPEIALGDYLEWVRGA